MNGEEETDFLLIFYEKHLLIPFIHFVPPCINTNYPLY